MIESVIGTVSRISFFGVPFRNPTIASGSALWFA